MYRNIFSYKSNKNSASIQATVFTLWKQQTKACKKKSAPKRAIAP